MTAAAHLGRAAELLEQAVAEIEAALPDTPDYVLESQQFLRAEIRACARRAGNAAKVLGATTRRPTGTAA